MNPRERTTSVRVLTVVVATAVVFLGTAATDATASCFGRPLAANRLTATVKPRVAAAPAANQVTTTGSQEDSPGESGPVEGLWRTVFTATAPFEGVYDEGLQQFHNDGTELMVSRGVPPDLGNVCVGVWVRTAGGVVTVKHVAWNWSGQSVFDDSDPFGSAFSNVSTGTFVLNVTLRPNRRGTKYSGTWTAASYDNDGVLVSGSEVEGTVEAERIAVD